MGCGSDCLPDPSPCLNCGNGVCDAGDRALTCPAECVVTDLAAGASATCGLRVDGTVWCWGSNYLGRLGNNSLDDSPVPVQVVDEGGFGLLTGVTDLDFGSGHGCAVKADGTVWCWGDNGWGALGDGSNQNRSSPVQVTRWLGALLEGVVAASTGTHHACALRGDGSVWCWGLNSRGQLGRNTQHGSLNTADFYAGQVLGQDAVGYLTDVTQVEAGEAHACAVRSDGSLWCWGGNVYGELGDGTTTDRLTPVPVLDPTGQAPLGDVVQVSAASSPHTYERHTCALTGAGAVYCWGINESGQLGDGTQTERHLPVRVRNAAGTGFLDDVVEISAGQTSTCAVNGSGTVLCWGYNGCGQLGDGTTIARALPSEVLDTDGAGPLTDVAAVSAGTLHTCARKVDGTVYCWGHGLEGELGNGEASSSSTPLPTLDWP
jgi:alpha-tubulin suppressor-like RCC1 family protein